MVEPGGGGSERGERKASFFYTEGVFSVKNRTASRLNQVDFMFTPTYPEEREREGGGGRKR